ncbi:deaD, partial [Symbiodinium necroappetens]
MGRWINNVIGRAMPQDDRGVLHLPTPEIKEQLHGIPVSYTASGGVDEKTRHRLIGNGWHWCVASEMQVSFPAFQTVMEEVEEWKNRPMEATVLQEGLEMERRFGRPYFDEKRGVGKVCDWLPHRGFGYLLCGSPPEKIIFRASDVPKDYLASKGGKVPMEADVEFNLAGTWRGRKRAKDLVFPMAGTFAELGLKPEVIEGAANSLGLDPRENPEAPALLNPAPVQQEAIPYILNGDNIVIAAETGSGKSLAYMLPMVQIIRGMAQARNMDYGLAYRAGCPLALAICPTRELAIQ